MLQGLFELIHRKTLIFQGLFDGLYHFLPFFQKKSGTEKKITEENNRRE
jgi:hypothetical protein